MSPTTESCDCDHSSRDGITGWPLDHLHQVTSVVYIGAVSHHNQVSLVSSEVLFRDEVTFDNGIIKY